MIEISNEIWIYWKECHIDRVKRSLTYYSKWLENSRKNLNAGIISESDHKSTCSYCKPLLWKRRELLRQLYRELEELKA